METYSQIKLTFTAELLESASDSVAFDFGVLPAIAASVVETWAPVRYTGGKVQEGSATGTPGERSAINFVAAFNADFNLSKLFTVEIATNVVTIKSNDATIEFEPTSVAVPASVTTEITNLPFVPFGIQTVSFAEAPAECTDVIVSIQTYQQMSEYRINGGAAVPVSTNPFTFTRPRSEDFGLSVTDGTSVDIRNIGTPRRLLSSGIIIDINFIPSGSSVTVQTLYPTGGDVDLSFQYSMDGSNYQASNSFPDILPGSYTMYVRDQFNCVSTRAFSISAAGISAPFHSLSKSNPVRFKYNVVWGDNANYKNDDNTLSCESDVPIPYKEIQHFQSGDNSVPVQFRSNYGNNNVNVRRINPDGSLAVFGQTVNQLTQNMNLKDRRDARKYSVDPPAGSFDPSPKAAIYFESGNIYNYDTGADIGDYTLNGGLPEWAVVGNYIFVGTGGGAGNWSRILDVVYDETKQAEVVITNISYSGSDVAVNDVRSIYNRHNYEVYQANIDMLTFLDQSIQVQVLSTDGVYPQVEYLSEQIDVRVRWLNTVDISYRNRTNTDLLFVLGLQCKIRMQLEKKYGKPIEETETYKTDSTVVLISAEIHEADVFQFSPMTKQMMWLVVRALSHSNVTMDGVEYVRDSIEVSEALEDTNLYDVTATMIKARNVYNSDSGNLEFSTGVIEIPALIETGTGFIKYQ